MLETTALRQQVLAWVWQCQREMQQNLSFAISSTAAEPTLMSLCFAILTAELFNALPEKQSNYWRQTLLSAQDPETGLFVDKAFSLGDLVPTSPGAEYLIHQTTYFALNALDALAGVPRYPLRFVEPYLDSAYMNRWLDNLNWSHPWGPSNQVMFIAAFLYVTWQGKDNRSALAALHSLLDWLDAHQDPETGFWGIQDGASLLHAMAAGYHFVPFYFCLGRRIHFPEQIIESTLALQQPDGLFHPEGGGDTCLDVDAVDLLVKCSLVTDHECSEIEAALERAFHGILDNQSEDGGFCRARHRPFPPKSWKRRLGEAVRLDRLLHKPYVPPSGIRYYSGWTKMPFDIRQGDLWSTWFRSYGLALINMHYPGKFPLDVHWRFRKLPALGWHHLESIDRSK